MEKGIERQRKYIKKEREVERKGKKEVERKKQKERDINKIE